MPTIPKDVPCQSKSPNQISQNTSIHPEINPGSRPTNPREIHPPRLPVQLMTTTQEMHTWMEKPREIWHVAFP
jgi:hypothetical protein